MNARVEPLRIYIAGPMTAIPHFNFCAFDRMRARLQEMGHDPVSPADLARSAGFDPYAPDSQTIGREPTFIRSAIRRNVDALLSCDAIVLLLNWEQSPGARAELAVAKQANLIIFRPGDVIPKARRQAS